MGYPALTVFLLFFGISLLDAFEGGHWLRGIAWVAVGLAFLGLDRMARGRQVGVDDKPGRAD